MDGIRIIPAVRSNVEPINVIQFWTNLYNELKIAEQSNVLSNYTFEFVGTGDDIGFYLWMPERLKNGIISRFQTTYRNCSIRDITKDYLDIITLNNTDISELYLSDTFLYALMITGGLSELQIRKDKSKDPFLADPVNSLCGILSIIPDNYQAVVQLTIKPAFKTWQQEAISLLTKWERYDCKPGLFNNFTNSMRKFFSGSSYSSRLDEKLNHPGYKVDIGGADTDDIKSIIQRKIDREEAFNFSLKISVTGKEKDRRREIIRSIASAIQEINYHNSLFLKEYDLSILERISFLDRIPFCIKPREHRFKDLIERDFNIGILEYMKFWFYKGYKNNVITPTEMATLFHLPNNLEENPNILPGLKRNFAPCVPPPANENFYTKNPFLQAENRGKIQKIGLSNEAWTRHMYFAAGTGSGKTTALYKIAMDLIENGEGIAIMEPHGDLINDILGSIPTHRIKDVIYFNPVDEERPIGINPLYRDLNSIIREELVAGDFADIIKNSFPGAWGANSSDILNNILMALFKLDRQVTIYDAISFASVSKFRSHVIANERLRKENLLVHTYWTEDFKELAKNANFLQTNLNPPKNKLRQLLTGRVMQGILTQQNPKLKIKEVYEQKKILLIDLKKGEIGEPNMKLLGSVFFNQLWQLCRQRKPEERHNYWLFIDEAQNFVQNNVKDVMSEARKYRLCLCLMNQQVDSQMEEDIKKSIWANAGTIMVGNLGEGGDRKYAAQQFEPYFTPADLGALEIGQVACKIMTEKGKSQPFTARIIRSDHKPHEWIKNKVIEHSRQTYGMAVEDWQKEMYETYKDFFDSYNAPGLDNSNNDKRSKAGAPPKLNNETASKNEIADGNGDLL